MSTALELPDRVVTFRTERGSFVIPAELLEDGNEHELARWYARGMPPGRKPDHVSRRVDKSGSVTISWRIIHVVDITPGMSRGR